MRLRLAVAGDAEELEADVGLAALRILEGQREVAVDAAADVDRPRPDRIVSRTVSVPSARNHDVGTKALDHLAPTAPARRSRVIAATKREDGSPHGVA